MPHARADEVFLALLRCGSVVGRTAAQRRLKVRSSASAAIVLPMNRHSVPNATMGYPGSPPNGGSRPRFYDFDDGVTRLVKWHPSVHGAKACYNELIASRLGQLVESPLLRGIVAFVPDDVIPADHRTEGATAGFHFTISRMEGENFIPVQHYGEIENSSELPAAAVHLAWLGVGDQEGHNQFLQRKVVVDTAGVSKQTKYFKLIDMGQAFQSFAWTAADIVTPHTSYTMPAHMVTHLTLAKLADPIARLKELSMEEITACISDRPEEWNIPDEDIEALAVRLRAGQDMIEDIIHAGNPTIV